MIERIGRVPGPPFYPRRQEIPPVEPVDSVVNQKRDTDTAEFSEEARRLLEEAEFKKAQQENEIPPEEESLE
jgi:hypothetical protein